jgi:hypothetical protein
MYNIVVSIILLIEKYYEGKSYTNVLQNCVFSPAMLFVLGI